MPSYEYRCDNGHEAIDHAPSRDDSSRYVGRLCDECSTPYKRVFSFQSARAGTIDGYFVPGLSANPDERFTPQQIETRARELSQRQTDRLGYEVNLRTVSMDDPIVAPDSDDGLKSQHDRAVASGRKESSPKIL